MADRALSHLIRSDLCDQSFERLPGGLVYRFCQKDEHLLMEHEKKFHANPSKRDINGSSQSIWFFIEMVMR